jgi:hypothetical protein
VRVIAVRSSHGVVIGYENWFVWRWLTRFPEDADFRDNPDVQARRAA